MAAGSQILMICLCRGESVKKSQNQDIRDERMIRMKGKAEGWALIAGREQKRVTSRWRNPFCFPVANFSDRDGREWRIPLFWRPVVPG